MKKTNKSNPLKTFNDNKAMAYKKAGGEMKAFKKSLTKANDGRIVGPQTEQQAKMSAIMNYQPPIPYANRQSMASMAEESLRGAIKDVNADAVKRNSIPFKEPSGTFIEPKSQSLKDAEKRYYEMKNSRGAKNGGSVKRKNK